jgi:excisionase family DNA binding protein
MSFPPKVVPKGVETLFSVNQAAAKLGCSTRLLYNEIKRGHLEAHRLGGSRLLRISPEALEAFQRRDTAAVDDWIAEQVAKAPPMSEDQIHKLITLLKPAREFLRS